MFVIFKDIFLLNIINAYIIPYIPSFFFLGEWAYKSVIYIDGNNHRFPMIIDHSVRIVLSGIYCRLAPPSIGLPGSKQNVFFSFYATVYVCKYNNDIRASNLSPVRFARLCRRIRKTVAAAAIVVLSGRVSTEDCSWNLMDPTNTFKVSKIIVFRFRCICCW